MIGQSTDDDAAASGSNSSSMSGYFPRSYSTDWYAEASCESHCLEARHSKRNLGVTSYPEHSIFGCFTC